MMLKVKMLSKKSVHFAEAMKNWLREFQWRSAFLFATAMGRLVAAGHLYDARWRRSATSGDSRKARGTSA